MLRVSTDDSGVWKRMACSRLKSNRGWPSPLKTGLRGAWDSFHVRRLLADTERQKNELRTAQIIFETSLRKRAASQNLDSQTFSFSTSTAVQ